MRASVELRKEGLQFGETVNEWKSPNTAGYVSVSPGWRWARRSWTRARWQPRWVRALYGPHRSSMSQPRTTKSHRPRSNPWTWTWWTDRIHGFRPTVSSYNIVPISSLHTRIYGLMVRTVTVSLSTTVTVHTSTVRLVNDEQYSSLNYFIIQGIICCLTIYDSFDCSLMMLERKTASS